MHRDIFCVLLILLPFEMALLLIGFYFVFVWLVLDVSCFFCFLTKRLNKKNSGLHKNAGCYFEQILGVAPDKTAVLRLFTSHLTNHSRRIRHAGIAVKRRIHKRDSPPHGNTNVAQTITYIYLLFADIGYCVVKLPRVMSDRDVGRKSVIGIRAVSPSWW